MAMTRIIAEYYALALALVLDALGWVAFFCYAVTTLGDTP